MAYASPPGPASYWRKTSVHLCGAVAALTCGPMRLLLYPALRPEMLRLNLRLREGAPRSLHTVARSAALLQSADWWQIRLWSRYRVFPRSKNLCSLAAGG